MLLWIEIEAGVTLPCLGLEVEGICKEELLMLGFGLLVGIDKTETEAL